MINALNNNILSVSPQSIKSLGFVREDTNDQVLSVSIKTAQDLKLLPVVGTQLMDRILSTVRLNENDEKIKTLRENFIIYIIGNLVKSQTLISSYQVGNKGTVQSSGDNVVLPSLKDLQAISSYYESVAESYMKLLKDYISQNIQDYPEYNLTDPGDTKPTDSVFKCPIVL